MPHVKPRVNPQFTVKQAAKALNVTPRAVLARIHRKTVKAEQLDGWMWVIGAKEVKRLLKKTH